MNTGGNSDTAKRFANQDCQAGTARDEAGRWMKGAFYRSHALQSANLRRLAILRYASGSRPARAAEMDRMLAYLAQAENANQGYRDIYWALLNSAEFVLNR